ncbi:GNAT family N-acetyltransferase [Rhodococcus aerolatus]
MVPSATIRPATRADAPGCAAVYRPWVEGTAVSFEAVAPDAAEVARRIDAARAWLVAEEAGTVLGYAYAGVFNARAAYDASVSTSVYLAPDARGRGLGGALYRTLLGGLPALGVHRAFAGVALPNPASEALHARVGFTPVGVFTEAGHKLGRWHDVAWFAHDLVGLGR